MLRSQKREGADLAETYNLGCIQKGEKSIRREHLPLRYLLKDWYQSLGP